MSHNITHVVAHTHTHTEHELNKYFSVVIITHEHMNHREIVVYCFCTLLLFSGDALNAKSFDNDPERE